MAVINIINIFIMLSFALIIILLIIIILPLIIDLIQQINLRLQIITLIPKSQHEL